MVLAGLHVAALLLYKDMAKPHCPGSVAKRSSGVFLCDVGGVAHLIRRLQISVGKLVKNCVELVEVDNRRRAVLAK
jgi:hypothetical protein